jgi:GNAT superfamily N-acetyltransferase
VLLNGILRFSEQGAGPPLLLLMSDAESAAIIGGLWGRTSWLFLYVELFYVPDLLRGQGFGSQLLRQAEAERTEQACFALTS